ncbi:hypothetical protein [Roseivirga misakiensis]|uniref:Uncharacterized protein n=1 Tax=Roseivirga misakiensis TaxID=1563681 RepID=A0A1E5T5Q2_9BACT|nr:hypothetical protein [Roseivirga misakiensis]OEK06712.1 hypothetical protein BFP71_03355 [Roseivirga misakiensis]
MTDKSLNKGYKTEELLRSYFQEIGYYVVRGCIFWFKEKNVTDVDLWLYNRPSVLERKRIIVDSKRGASPKALQRILWTLGMKEILGADDCIVATNDRSRDIKDFGELHQVGVLDGSFIQRLKLDPTRFTEEEFLKLTNNQSEIKQPDNWNRRYQNSKSRLLSKLNFSGCIQCLNDIKYFLEQVVHNPSEREKALRLSYAITSHFLIIVDFILKNLPFLDKEEKSQRLINGLRYGTKGKDFMELTLKISKGDTGTRKWLDQSLKDIPVKDLADFLLRPEISKSLFQQAVDLESLAYSKHLVGLKDMEILPLSTLYVLADYFGIKRVDFKESASSVLT